MTRKRSTAMHTACGKGKKEKAGHDVTTGAASCMQARFIWEESPF